VKSWLIKKDDKNLRHHVENGVYIKSFKINAHELPKDFLEASQSLSKSTRNSVDKRD